MRKEFYTIRISSTYMELCKTMKSHVQLLLMELMTRRNLLTIQYFQILKYKGVSLWTTQIRNN